MLKRLYINIKLFIHYLMRGLFSADKLTFGPKDTSTNGQNVSINENIENKSVWNDLLNGEETEEVKELRHSLYKVDKESGNYKYVGNGNVIKKDNTPSLHVMVDESDNLPIQLIQDNNLITENVLDSLSDIENNIPFNKKYVINIDRDFTPRFKLEEFSNKVVVKLIDENKVQLDFYCSQYDKQFDRRYRPFINELYKIMGGNLKSDIIDFEKVSFVTYKSYGSENSLYYEYDKIKFKECIIFDGNFVLKFNAHIKENGIDLTQKYFNSTMDNKYKNKERKGNDSITWTPKSTESEYDLNTAIKLNNELKK